ncbi:molybdopterin oxidoreductase family protein [Tessaracoccus flavus]|uniref:Nitrite reductase n=1 Tax=Tessaracoccus flavus TaxID=1610493 RepID=A0A1Q2CGI8_9ACTN|nr:molybdopterin oxidoreductase family protein [Tessaracoccus flavus]AQP45239.1 nitrite reductase [Tessaracoccus flavus]SDY51776.1 assimilatory nitrate reductase (NADH) alpha subunit apoprotein [Tessaracoccus flavus]
MTATHCPYCALQCAMEVAPTGTRGATPTITPLEFPTNRGRLCQKGWTAAEVLTTPDRLTSPLIRRDDELVPTDWDTALSFVADTLLRLRADHGPESVAVFGGGGLTNEKAYQLGRFARVALATPNIDYNGRFCMSSAAAGGRRAFGLDRGLPFPLTDLDGADAIVLVGSNPAETMPPFVTHLAGTQEGGGLIVVDPRRTPTAALTSDGRGLHLSPLPGTDLVLLLGLTQILWTEGLVDRDYLAERASGVDELRASMAAWWPERVERVTGVPVADIRRAARLLAAASPARGGRGAYVLTGRGAEQHAHGTDTVTAAVNLALCLGLPGRVGSGYGCLTGQGNGQGGREHGLKADQLPGYRSISDPAARAHVAEVWGIDPDSLPGPGLPAVALFESLATPGGPRAMLVHGANPVVSLPDVLRLTERLGALDLLVVSDFVLSETAAMADVVLPVTQWAEETGTMTNLEGRLLLRAQATEPPVGVRTELEVWSDLAERLGSPIPFSPDPAVVFDELARASAGGVADYSGFSHARLRDGEALYWPCPAPDHPGTPRVFLDRFATPDGRAVLHPVDQAPPDDALTPELPLYLVTGRVLQHYQSGAQTRRVPALADVEPEAYVELHPLLAGRLGIGAGDRVAVHSRRGSCEAVARLTEGIRLDTVFMPFHYPDAGAVNRVTNAATDPISGMPELKVAAVRLEAIRGAA